MPSCKCVLASMTGGGLKLKTVCRHLMQAFMFLDTRKLSASPSSAMYHESWLDDILWTTRCGNVGYNLSESSSEVCKDLVI